MPLTFDFNDYTRLLIDRAAGQQKGFIDMTKAVSFPRSLFIKFIVGPAVLAMAGCAGLNAPTEQSIADLPPSGSVTITEDFVAGLGGGNGTLYFNGQTYPFKVLGSVVGPGGASKITASGPVYKLASIADFPGRYTQSSGSAGLSTSGGSDLWLRNSAGVIMHLQGASTGVLLSLGKEEIIIRMAQQ